MSLFFFDISLTFVIWIFHGDYRVSIFSCDQQGENVCVTDIWEADSVSIIRSSCVISDTVLRCNHTQSM